MKQYQKAIIAAAICLVLAVGMSFVIPLFSKEAEEITPSNTAEDGMLMIIQKSATAVKKIEVTVDGGENFTIEYSLDENGSQVPKLIGGDENLAYNESLMCDLTGYVGFMAAIQQIDGANDKDFGFDKPQRKIKISYTDGEVIELHMGKDAPSGDGIYLKRIDTGIVYLVGGSTTDMLMRTLPEYRVFTLFGPYSDTTLIRKVTIEREGQDKLIIEAKSSSVSTSEETYVAQYEIISPVQADVANDALEVSLLKPLIEIEAEALVEDNPKDLSKYGLDHPVRVEFTDSESKTVAFLVGAPGENGGSYVMLEGSSSVVLTKAPVTFTSVDYTDVMLKLIWLHNMDTISSITYKVSGGATHNYVLNSTNPVSATFDNVALSTDNISHLFQLTVGFTLQGKLDSSMKYGDAKLSIDIRLKDGSITTMQLAEINERHYAAIIDGTARYYVNVTQVDALLNAFDIIASGGTIPEVIY